MNMRKRVNQAPLQTWEDEGGSVCPPVKDGMPTKHGPVREHYFVPGGWPPMPRMASMRSPAFDCAFPERT
ncbi:hypothetical protein J2T57_003933 [Natronocella acetinitrilica]|uniref:Uncharacterized protein n=1 Tax=Natronocella acetinitrilica TaxID=414046 RepID=A0AAE3KCE2_9GAMM|nr:hypothetical protein [Natronocella acetinitrilica]MCP1676760.1 hypothetical protein [Natronocella acetinitrilica]